MTNQPPPCEHKRVTVTLHKVLCMDCFTELKPPRPMISWTDSPYRHFVDGITYDFT